MNAHDRLSAMAAEFRLSAGKHVSVEDGMCAMELVAFLDGGPHTDHPRCASETISDFVRHINDHLPDNLRHRLLAYVPRIIGTVSAEHEQECIEYFAWKTIRVFAPAALRAQGYKGFPAALERAEDLYKAMRVAQAIRERISNKRELTPVDLAVHRAYRAAASAQYSALHQHVLFWDEYSNCGYLAASAAFQAYEAGSADIWERVFETLERVLAIGSPQQRNAEPAERTEFAHV